MPNPNLSPFVIPNVITFAAGNGGLTKAVITAPRGSAEIYLHGATVTHFQPAGSDPMLWVSKTTAYDREKPIRGGVPVLFPWFGPHPQGLGQHGFARITEWNVLYTGANPDGSATVVLGMSSTESTKKSFPHDFSIRYTITVGQHLDLTFEVTNHSPNEIIFEEGLHTYFRTPDIRQTEVTGLDGVTFIDKVAGDQRKVQHGPVKFPGEIDWVYQDTPHTCSIYCAGQRLATVAKEGSISTVVWNPSEAKGESLPDLAGQWRNFVCVETVNNYDNRVKLAAGKTHTMRSIIFR